MDEWIPFANFREEDGSMPKFVAVASVGSVKSTDNDDSGSPGSTSPSDRSAATTKKARLSSSTEPEVHDARAPTVAAAAAADVLVVKKNENVGEFIEELTTDAMDEESLKEHDELTKVKNVGELEIGRYRIDTWSVCFCARCLDPAFCVGVKLNEGASSMHAFLWTRYFSPYPKEVIPGGFLPRLYLCT